MIYNKNIQTKNNLIPISFALIAAMSLLSSIMKMNMLTSVLFYLSFAIVYIVFFIDIVTRKDIPLDLLLLLFYFCHKNSRITTTYN